MESDLTMGFGIILQAKYICLPILRFQLVAGLFREICCSLSFSCFFGDSCVLFLQLNLSTFFFVVDLRRFAFLGLFFSTGASRHRQDCNYCGFFVFSFSVCFPRLFKLLSTTCDERAERIKKSCVVSFSLGASFRFLWSQQHIHICAALRRSACVSPVLERFLSVVRGAFGRPLLCAFFPSGFLSYFLFVVYLVRCCGGAL